MAKRKNDRPMCFFYWLLSKRGSSIIQSYTMKINKYDRQIRLWGPKGQKRLTEARVALLSCTGAGVEALKNLVLPGVGHI